MYVFSFKMAANSNYEIGSKVTQFFFEVIEENKNKQTKEHWFPTVVQNPFMCMGLMNSSAVSSESHLIS